MPRFNGTRITIILLLVFIVVFGWWCFQQRTTETQDVRDARMDTLRMARQYDSLAGVIYDLEREIHSRSLHEVLPEVKRPKGTSRRPLAAAVPVIPYVAPPKTSDLAPLMAAAGPAVRQRTEVVFVEDEVREKGLEEWLRTAGFRSRQVRGERPRANPQGQLPPNIWRTTSLTFGDSVPLPVVKLVALEMLRHNLGVKRIRRAEGQDDASVIRLDPVSHMETTTPLTVEQIKSLSLPRPAPRR